MADKDNANNGENLDSYLEGLGIEMGEDADRPLPEDHDLEAPLPVPGVVREEGDLAERTEIFLVNLLLNFDPSYAVEVKQASDQEVSVEIFGGEPGKVIGRGGQTLNALEYVTNAVMNRNEGSNVRVNIDVGGYKRRRDDRLRASARKLAAKVGKTGQPVEMDPMSAAERRVVHMSLIDEPGVVTESEGQGRNRRVVIKPS
jgi:spoIIIJ-associated protein